MSQKMYEAHKQKHKTLNKGQLWPYTFGGLMVEKGWEESNITTFAEAQYNYAQSDAAYHSNALNRMNFTIGVRYYLDRRGF